MKRNIVVMLLLAVLILPGLAAAQAPVTWVKHYNPALEELPEGIAVDRQGNIYVGLVPLGQVRKLSPDGAESILYQFPPGTMVVGLALDPPGNLYVGVVALGNPEIHGVWKIDRHGQGTHLPGTEAIGLPPNGLAFDPHGNLYVTGSWVLGTVPPNAQGSIWRIPRGGEAELWYQDVELLGGLGALGGGYAPIGANGIAYYHRALYVANSERGHIVRFPILPDGGPGEPEVLVADPGLWMIDGITMNVYGTIFAALVLQDRIVSVCPRTGAIQVLAEGDPVDGPASPTLAAGSEGVSTLYFTNYAVLSEAQPGILKLELDWPPGNRR